MRKLFAFVALVAVVLSSVETAEARGCRRGRCGRGSRAKVMHRHYVGNATHGHCSNGSCSH